MFRRVLKVPSSATQSLLQPQQSSSFHTSRVALALTKRSGKVSLKRETAKTPPSPPKTITKAGTKIILPRTTNPNDEQSFSFDTPSIPEDEFLAEGKTGGEYKSHGGLSTRYMTISWPEVRTELQNALAEISAGDTTSFKALQKMRAYLKEVDVVTTFTRTEEAMECLYFLQLLGFPQKSILESSITTWVVTREDPLSAADILQLCRYADGGANSYAAQQSTGADAFGTVQKIVGGVEPWLRLLCHDSVASQVTKEVKRLELSELTLVMRILKHAGGTVVSTTQPFHAVCDGVGEALAARLKNATVPEMCAAWYHGGTASTKDIFEAECSARMSMANADTSLETFIEVLTAINYSTKNISGPLLHAIINHVAFQVGVPFKADSSGKLPNGVSNFVEKCTMSAKLDTNKFATFLQCIAPHFSSGDALPELLVGCIRVVSKNPTTLSVESLSNMIIIGRQLGFNDLSLVNEVRNRAATVDISEFSTVDDVTKFALMLRTLGGGGDRVGVTKLLGKLEAAHLQAVGADALGNIAEAMTSFNFYPRRLMSTMAERAVDLRSQLATHQISVILFCLAQCHTALTEEVRDDTFVHLFNRAITISKFGQRTLRFEELSAAAAASGQQTMGSHDVALMLRAVDTADFSIAPGSKIHKYLIESATSVLSNFETSEIVWLLLVATNLKLGMGSTLVKGLIQQLRRHIPHMNPTGVVEAIDVLHHIENRDMDTVQTLLRQFLACAKAASLGDMCRLAQGLMNHKFNSLWKDIDVQRDIITRIEDNSWDVSSHPDVGLLVYLSPTKIQSHMFETIVAQKKDADEKNSLKHLHTRVLTHFMACEGIAADEHILILREILSRVNHRKKVMEAEYQGAKGKDGKQPISKVIPVSVVAKELIGTTTFPSQMVAQVLGTFVRFSYSSSTEDEFLRIIGQRNVVVADTPKQAAFNKHILSNILLEAVCTAEELVSSGFDHLTPTDIRTAFEHVSVIVDKYGVPFGLFRLLGKPLAEVAPSLTADETITILRVYHKVKVRDDRVLRALFAQTHAHKKTIMQSREMVGVVKAAIAEYGGHWAGPIAAAMASINDDLTPKRVGSKAKLVRGAKRR